MVSSKDAPNFKIIKSNLNNYSVSNATVVVPEEKKAIIDLSRTKDYMLITYSDGINSYAKQYNLHNGDISPIDLPLSGTLFMQPFDVKTNDA